MMKKKFLFSAAFVLALVGTACSNAEDIVQDGPKSLKVSVVNNAPETRSIITGTTLPGGSEIGVTVLNTDGTAYDGVTYSNLKYTTANGADWTVSGSADPLLSSTDGKAIAYFPWGSTVDYNAIAITTDDQTDNMYSGWTTKAINNSNPEAEFTMNHAKSAFRIVLKKDAGYKAVAKAVSITAKSDYFVESAVLDATKAAGNNLSAWSTGAGETTVSIDGGITLTADGQSTDIMVVPAQTAGTSFEFTIAIEDANGNTKNYVVTPTFDLNGGGMLQGKCYQFTLTLTATGFVASTVAVTEWGQVTNAGSGSLAPEKPIVGTIDLTTASNGVYAIAQNGKGVAIEDADATATGVALIAGEHKFMIAKADATDGTNNTLYWGKNLCRKDVAGITNISKGNGYIGEGRTYGTDFTTWSTGPVVDFNGKDNTAAIIAGYTEHNVSMEARDMCTVLNTFNASDSHNDWYVPACGQLALMYLNMTEINAALAKIGGTALAAGDYWSSSEFSTVGAWSVRFYYGIVDDSRWKDVERLVRFIRDI